MDFLDFIHFIFIQHIDWIVVVGFITIIVISIFQATAHAILHNLYIALSNMLVDYSFKFFLLIKNLFYLPLGVDSRVFQHQFSVIRHATIAGSTAQKAVLVRVTNTRPITFNNHLFLTCIFVYGVSGYVLFAMYHIFESIYGKHIDNNFIKVIPFILSAAVFWFDTIIVRSLSLSSIPPSKWQKRLMWVFRLLVTGCIALLATFHMLCVLYKDDIHKRAIDQHYTKTSGDALYSSLLNQREALINNAFHIEVLHTCAGVLMNGYDKNTALNSIPSVPREKYLEILKEYQLPDETRVQKPLETPNWITNESCAKFIQNGTSEPQCKNKSTSRNPKICGNLTTRAKEGFNLEAKIFGTDAAVKRGWFGVSESSAFPELKKPFIPEEDSDWGKFDALKQKVFSESFEESAALDLSDAAELVTAKFWQSSLAAKIILSALVILLITLEVLNLVYKIFVGKTILDDYYIKLDTENRIIISGTPFGQTIKAHMEYDSDFSIEEHIGAIAHEIRELLERTIMASPPTLGSRIMTFFILGVLFLEFFNLIASSLPLVEQFTQLITKIFTDAMTSFKTLMGW